MPFSISTQFVLLAVLSIAVYAGPLPGILRLESPHPRDSIRTLYLPTQRDKGVEEQVNSQTHSESK